MSKDSPDVRGWTAALAVICTMGWVSDAEAVIQKRRWDPAYGVDLPNLGWSGEVDFDIADGCLATVDTGWIDNYGTNAACFNKLSIKSATVTLYDIDSSGNPGPLGDVTLSYGSKFFSDYNAPITLRMYVEGGEIKAVQGGFLFPEFVKSSSAPFAVAADYDYSAFWLSFNANAANNFGLDSTAAPSNGYAFLTNCSFNGNGGPSANQTLDRYTASHPGVECSQNGYGEANQAILRPVPEPEAYMLGLAAFGVLGVWARRRRLNTR